MLRKNALDPLVVHWTASVNYAVQEIVQLLLFMKT